MPKSFLAAVALGVLLLSPAHASKLYKWKDASGQTHYSQTPPPAGEGGEVQESTLAGSTEGGKISPYCLALGRFSQNVHGAARQGVPIASVAAVSHRAEREHLGHISQGQLTEIANYVYMMSRGPESSAEIAKRVEDRCMRGDFGQYDSAQAAGEGAPSDGGGAGQAAGGSKSGTGWFAAPNAILTNLHVVKGSREISVVLDSGRTISARLWRTDEARDLALLSVTGADDVPSLPIAATESRLGAKVFTIGFPHTGVMGVKPKLTDGVISARSGLGDDPDMYQISVPVQSGNSGGPLLDEQGNVVGIVTAKLSAGAMYRATEDLTENVNFAIKSIFARDLAGDGGSPAGGGSLEDVAERVQRSVVRVLAN
jgi:S1-C subfamily serine protease